MTPQQERQLKHALVCDYLAARGLDGVLLTRRCNFSWYTCGAHNHVGLACDVGVASLLVTRDGATVLANNIEATRLREEELSGSGIRVVEYPWHDVAAAAKTFAEASRSMRLAADASAGGLKAEPLGRDFDRLRWTLNENEIARYRALCADATGVLDAVGRAARPGMTEHRLAGLLAAEMYARGCTPWTVLLAADRRIERHRHPLPTDLRVERYFMLIVGAERHGLIASHSRLASFGPVPAELADKHRAVATVDAALIGATRAGATLGEIFAEGQAAYDAVGHADQWRRHHQGGSCGYLPRDVKAAPGETLAALANQAFAWNPSITGTKSEDTILCTPNGPELLAPAGAWPTIRAEWKGFVLNRPDILVLA
ncbi:MAG TPA: M24 family metallopeptidase [Phycisphaerae bacterium]|nr:M24 family metallopeptidase [Phycisphaerae bacterium]